MNCWDDSRFPASRKGLGPGSWDSTVARGAADLDHDGIITADELAPYVKRNVSSTAFAQLGARQNPQVGRRGEGEFVFLSPRGAQASVPAAPDAAFSYASGGLPRPTPRIIHSLNHTSSKAYLFSSAFIIYCEFVRD